MFPDTAGVFVMFGDDETAMKAGGAPELTPPILVIMVDGFSLCSDALSETWMMTADAMRAHRNAVCCDAEGRQCRIAAVVPQSRITLLQRLMPWVRLPARLVAERGPSLTTGELRAALIAILEGRNGFGDHLRVSPVQAIAVITAAETPQELIAGVRAMMP